MLGYSEIPGQNSTCFEVFISFHELHKMAEPYKYMHYIAVKHVLTLKCTLLLK